jgi:hypothetical protein
MTKCRPCDRGTCDPRLKSSARQRRVEQDDDAGQGLRAAAQGADAGRNRCGCFGVINSDEVMVAEVFAFTRERDWRAVVAAREARWDACSQTRSGYSKEAEAVDGSRQKHAATRSRRALWSFRLRLGCASWLRMEVQAALPGIPGVIYLPGDCYHVEAQYAQARTRAHKKETTMGPKTISLCSVSWIDEKSLPQVGFWFVAGAAISWPRRVVMGLVGTANPEPPRKIPVVDAFRARKQYRALTSFKPLLNSEWVP